MTEVFISYSSKDQTLADKFKLALDTVGLNTFLAPVSIKGGKVWKSEILKNLKEATWVFFLATENSCESKAVMHEIGASLILEKELIPLLWGVKPEQLPDWIQDRQAIELHDPTNERALELIEKIAQKAKINRVVGTLILVGLGVFVGYLLLKGE